jgi:signal transduction histidine kinase
VPPQLKRSHVERAAVDTGAESVVLPVTADKNEQKEPSASEQSTWRIACEPNRRRWEALIACTTDAMFILDGDFSILDLNPAACSALGLAREEATGQPCSALLRCCNLNKTPLCGTSNCPLQRAYALDQPVINEELLLAENLEVSISATPITTANVRREAAFIARDMSALHVANRVRSNFVSMVSHELRTPLNSVQGFVDLLIEGHMGRLNGEQRKYLGYAQQGVQQLITIVEDILFLTRSDVGQFEIRPRKYSFRALARQAISGLEPQARKADVILRKDIASSMPMLSIDPQRMKQVLDNLLTNAIKFTPPGGTVTLHARPHNEHFALISVSDTGYGIAERDRPHIFERFYQSENQQQSRIGGYGLGLAIAKLIVEQQGGTINFETELDHGTTFYFTAPIYDEDMQ